jgi:hypothetical protein
MEAREFQPKRNQGLALEDYNLVILGDGTGATLAAWTFASQGKRVAVIEPRYIGASCPNTFFSSEQEHYSVCQGGSPTFVAAARSVPWLMVYTSTCWQCGPERRYGVPLDEPLW